MDQHANLMADLFEEKAASSSGYAIAYALMQLAKEQAATARQISWLGTGDAATTMGAIELLAVELKGVGASLENISQAISEVVGARIP